MLLNYAFIILMRVVFLKAIKLTDWPKAGPKSSSEKLRRKKLFDEFQYYSQCISFYSLIMTSHQEKHKTEHQFT